jgi:hypothetical protein
MARSQYLFIQEFIDVYYEHIAIQIESGSNNNYKALP